MRRWTTADPRWGYLEVRSKEYLNSSAISCSSVSSPVEVRVEDPHRRDLVRGQLVELGRLPDGVGAGRVVDAEGLPVVLRHVGVHPRDAKLGVRAYHRHARLSAFRRQWDLQAIGKCALDHETCHSYLLGDGGPRGLPTRAS